MPAAGNYNGTTLQNLGTNGNYWAATLNNATNAYNLNFNLTRKQLLFDLHLAYYYAARHKQKMSYVVKFKRNLKENLEQLCDDLLSRRYKPLPSKCFRHRLSEEA